MIANVINSINSRMLFMLALASLLVGVILVSIIGIYRDARLKRTGRYKEKGKREKVNGGIIDKLNANPSIQRMGEMIPNTNIDDMFNRSKNPWGMSVGTFQFIRYFGLAAGLIAFLIFIMFSVQVAVPCLIVGIMCYWYPTYYYTAIGQERENEWAKMYEYVWVLKNNLSLYDPAKAYLNTKAYIQDHAPNNKEIIQGFQDFYEHWDDAGIDPYLQKYYSFPITREILQITYNMFVSGEFPEDSLNNLRAYIINRQDLMVTKTLSGVAGKATAFSLPFLMVSVILALLVPLVMQLVSFL